MSEPRAILLFDGTCGFCAKSVQFVLAHEGARRSLRFASLQSSVGHDLRRRRPELERVDSLIWFEPANSESAELVLVRSGAVLRVSRYLGWPWSAFGTLAALVPAFARDGMYDFVARHRHQLVRAGPSCLLPTPEQRARFIEWEQMTAA